MIQTTAYYEWLLDALVSDEVLHSSPKGLTADENRGISDAFMASLPPVQDPYWQATQRAGVRRWIRTQALACMGVPT